MRLRRLQLHQFRCFDELDVGFAGDRVVVAGGNGQGKSSLLEAIYFLATTRAAHAASERELVGWPAAAEPGGFSRAAGIVERSGRDLTIEVVLLPPTSSLEGGLAKRVRVNGAARRAIDAIGLLNVVLFTPRHLDLVDGAPQQRRRYLDVLLCQIDHEYTRALSRYNRLIAHRNTLLRRVRDQGASRSELDVWDERLAADGGAILDRRLLAVGELRAIAATVHAELVGAEDAAPPLVASYVASHAEEATGQHASDGPDVLHAAGAAGQGAALLEALGRRRAQDVSRGATSVGPHRDDLSFSVGGVDMRLFGSRGQQRTVSLAWKLAEARLMQHQTGERPVLLLDDVLSELDAARRAYVLAAIDPAQQTLLTTTDPERLDPGFVAGAQLLRVDRGAVASVP